MEKKYTLFSCRIIFSFIFFVLTTVSYTQPANLYAYFGVTWNDYSLTDRGITKAVTVQSLNTGTGACLFNTAPAVWSPKWCGSTTDYNRNANQKITDGAFYYTSGGWDHDLNFAIQANYYYTFITGKNALSNNDMSVIETSFNPVDITNVTQNPSSVQTAQNVTVTVSVSGSLGSGEHVFVRYSQDSWATSGFLEVTNFNITNQGIVTIPGKPAGIIISYYALSTNQATPDSATIDYYTLKINNNGNINYGYTVVATTGCPFSFDFGNDTTVCGGAGFLLDPGITISPYGDSLTITYDATEGQSGLAGAPKVYMHAGAEIHTNGGWQYVKGNWGLDDGVGLMTNVGTDLWQIKINPVTYFGYPADSVISGLLMMFRNANGSLTGKDDLGNDIWINMKTSPPASSFIGVTPAFLKNNFDSIWWSNGAHTQTLLVASTGSYICTIFNSGGGCSYTDSIHVTVQPIPYVNIGNDQVLCVGDSVTLTANPATFAGYNWSTGATTSSINVDTSGTYSLTVTASSGCTGFDVVTIDFVDPPVADFSYSATGFTVHFTDLSTGGTSYSWDFNGNGTPESTTAGNVTYTYAVPGQYNVILIVSNGCSSDTINEMVFVTTGIEENEEISWCHIFPNPAAGDITISLDNPDISMFEAEIYDAMGNRVYMDAFHKQAQKFNVNIDISGLSEGIYYIRIKNDQYNFVKKVVVSN